jgi:hypothetical protein
MVFITVALSHYKCMKPLYSTTSHKEAHLSNLIVADAEGLSIHDLHERRGVSDAVPGTGVLTVLIGVNGMTLILPNTVLIIVANKNMVFAVILASVMVLIIVLMSSGAWMGDLPSLMPGRSSSTAGSSSTLIAVQRRAAGTTWLWRAPLTWPSLALLPPSLSRGSATSKLLGAIKANTTCCWTSPRATAPRRSL